MIEKRQIEEKRDPSRPIKENKGETVAPLKTAQKIAEQSKVSPRTVYNAEKFANAVDKVAENTLPKLPPSLFSSWCFDCFLIL